MTAADKALCRRSLLRLGFAIAGGSVAAAVTGCSSGASSPTSLPVPSSGSASSAGTNSRPPELATIPSGYTSPAAAPGTLVELSYDTFESMTYEQRSEELTKRAIVYLPNGYDETARYNVFYLMHGGWGEETTLLGTPQRPSSFKNVIDHSIAEGVIEPLIIVCPTYNNTSEDDSANFGLALTLTANYHHELVNDLMPAVEGRYSTYAADVSPEGLAASRDHRGFGGFSMGSVATWRTFQHGLDYFRYFLPMSCGTSLDMDEILDAAQDRESGGYFVWIIIGSNDFAHPYDEERAALLRTSPYFTDADDQADGNFAYRLKQGYGHDGRAADEYTYNGLTWFWSR